jgi:hypothetical protein
MWWRFAVERVQKSREADEENELRAVLEKAWGELERHRH